MVGRAVKFSSGGTKLERFCPKNKHTQWKWLNFENRFIGELSKIGHHSSIKMIKKCTPNFVFSLKKIEKDSDDLLHEN